MSDIAYTKQLYINAIRGSSPDLSKLDELKGLCEYSDSYGRFSWSTSSLEEMSLHDLVKLYDFCIAPVKLVHKESYLKAAMAEIRKSYPKGENR